MDTEFIEEAGVWSATIKGIPWGVDMVDADEVQDTANRRINNEEDIVNYNTKSLFIVVMFWIFILVILKLRILMSLIIPILTGLLWQAFTITPGGYQFIQTIDRVLTFGKRSDI